jgi:hypothetical protein
MNSLLSLLVLIIVLVAAGPSHAQRSTTGPTFPYPAGDEQSDGRPNWVGQSDHIYQGRASTDRLVVRVTRTEGTVSSA